MSTAYIDRTNNNQEVYRLANLEMGEGAGGMIRPLTDIKWHLTRQTKWFMGYCNPWKIVGFFKIFSAVKRNSSFWKPRCSLVFQRWFPPAKTSLWKTIHYLWPFLLFPKNQCCFWGENKTVHSDPLIAHFVSLQYTCTYMLCLSFYLIYTHMWLVVFIHTVCYG